MKFRILLVFNTLLLRYFILKIKGKTLPNIGGQKKLEIAIIAVVTLPIPAFVFHR